MLEPHIQNLPWSHVRRALLAPEDKASGNNEEQFFKIILFYATQTHSERQSREGTILHNMSAQSSVQLMKTLFSQFFTSFIKNK